MEYTERYLLMVTTNNNNKYYRMIPSAGGDSFTVEYGRVGASCQRRAYPMYSWETKYNEKIRKGYVDQTHLHTVSEVVKSQSAEEDEFLPIKDETIRELIEFLQNCSRQIVRKNYRVKSADVTMQMVQEAQRIIDTLTWHVQDGVDASTFNDTLLKLFTVIPRKMSNVNHYLATKPDEFAKILEHEQEILDVMAGQVNQNTTQEEPKKKATAKKKAKTILDVMGLKIVPVKKTEITTIKKLLGQDANRFYAAWKVVNKRTQRNFDDFLKEEGDIETKLLWHGSRNENWISIMQSGLVLRPVAQVTGKMFGQGIYFAPKAHKSLGYTSLEGSYWVGGRSSRAFMALFEVAYGTPCHVETTHGISNRFGYDDLQRRQKGAHCLHAHAGCVLRNDEIIFYKENQVTIKYLVEIR